MSKKTILNLALTDSGGAGKAALLFNEMFNKYGFESLLVVQSSNEKNKNVIVLPEKAKNIFSIHIILKKFKSLFLHLLLIKKYYFYNHVERKKVISAKEILKVIPFVPDVIVLHWITGFVNTELIHDLEKITKAKFFWIMMDNAPLTGGCHFPWNCVGFESSCSNCPAIKLSMFKKLAYDNLEFKKKLIPKSLILLSCSTTDYLRAKQASVFKENQIDKILLPVDSDKFSIGDRSLAKKHFSIGLSQKVIFCGATDVLNIRKGFKYFLEAILIFERTLKLNNISLDTYVILLAGNIDPNFLLNIEIPLVIVGTLDEKNLIMAYQSAEVFVSTSIEDSGPLMINQSIMCGTPVVSFNIGVAVDLVRNNVTGYSSEIHNSNLLADNIYKILSINELYYLNMRKKCREIALNEFSYNSCFLTFNKLINNSSTI